VRRDADRRWQDHWNSGNYLYCILKCATLTWKKISFTPLIFLAQETNKKILLKLKLLAILVCPIKFAPYLTKTNSQHYRKTSKATTTFQVLLLVTLKTENWLPNARPMMWRQNVFSFAFDFFQPWSDLYSVGSNKYFSNCETNEGFPVKIKCLHSFWLT
jgi:hypothetical protein